MEQMQIPAEMLVPFDFSEATIPQAVKTLQPAIFRDGENFCCLLGPSREEGIVGCGETIDAAIKEWDKKLKERIDRHREDDPVAIYVKDMLNASIYKIN